MNQEGGGCSKPRLCHCAPAWVTEQETLSQKRKKKETTLRKTETPSTYDIKKKMAEIDWDQNGPLKSVQSKVAEVTPLISTAYFI